MERKRAAEAISEYLYPDDSHAEGKKLRLKQQYFFVSAGIQSILRNFRKAGGEWSDIPNRIAVHINDTHPVLAIPELMRILIDEENISWDEAWRITSQTISYTNHTTLSEALETWPIDMVKNLLPRIYMIIEEIDKRFSQLVSIKYLGNQEFVKRVAIIKDGNIHMANLAVAGSYSVKGVSLLHTEILEKKLMKGLYQIFPEKFNNKTNGISHRRWLNSANPKLANLISESIGRNWIKEPGRMSELMPFSKDAAFKEEIQKIKHDNKLNLAKLIKEQSGIIVDTDSIFDVQVKRLHAYKRQVLNVLHIIDLYNRIKENPNLDMPSRTFIFGAKAAPSYSFAKNVIKLINEVGKIVNEDPVVNQKMKVVFLANYRVSLAEIIIPAADLSEQISTATKEASGTGNMKFMMNGALTMGTLDGANIEIKEAVGDENIFIFGLKPNEVHDYYQYGGYNSFEMYNNYADIHKIVDQLISGKMIQAYEATRDVYNALLVDNDQYFVLKDFHSYVDAQNRAAEVYRNKDQWATKAVINIAKSGKFSGDRTINEYAKEIWKIKPVSF